MHIILWITIAYLVWYCQLYTYICIMNLTAIAQERIDTAVKRTNYEPNRPVIEGYKIKLQHPIDPIQLRTYLTKLELSRRNTLTKEHKEQPTNPLG